MTDVQKCADRTISFHPCSRYRLQDVYLPENLSTINSKCKLKPLTPNPLTLQTLHPRSCRYTLSPAPWSLLGRASSCFASRLCLYIDTTRGCSVGVAELDTSGNQHSRSNSSRRSSASCRRSSRSSRSRRRVVASSCRSRRSNNTAKQFDNTWITGGPVA